MIFNSQLGRLGHHDRRPFTHGSRLPGVRSSNGRGRMRGTRRRLRGTRGRLTTAVAAATAVTAVLAAGCSGGADVETASKRVTSPQQILGDSEGRLNLIAWLGYAEDGSTTKSADWVTPFERQTGCRTNIKIADTSDAMVELMRTGNYDGVSASGDSSVRLIESGLAAPVNTSLLTNWADIAPFLKHQPYNSAGGQMYGVPHGYGANYLMYRKDKLTQPPTSWDVVFEKDSPAAGHISVYDSPTYIADAALYLKSHRPDLGITDPYELTNEQFEAAVKLLRDIRPNIGSYWHSYLDSMQSFKIGDTHAGTTWQLTANLTKDAGAPVETVLPREGATGWSDTWMIHSNARHPNCMYRWMNWITDPRIQAEQTQYFGEAAANPKACRYTVKGFCATYKVGDADFYKKISFWKTPVTDCGDSRGDNCVDYARWSQVWAEIKG